MLICEKHILDSDKVDFLDIELDGGDTKLFIDPCQIHIAKDDWNIGAKRQIITYFNKLLEFAINDQDLEAFEMLRYLREINETRMGYSLNKPLGKGFSFKDGLYLYNQIKKSKARKTGILRDIFDCQVAIPRVHRDKVSDFISNILQKYLIEYTRIECKKHNIYMETIKNPIRYWDGNICA